MNKLSLTTEGLDQSTPIIENSKIELMINDKYKEDECDLLKSTIFIRLTFLDFILTLRGL